MDDCVFCKIISGDILAPIVNENENIIVFLSLAGHPLIVPKAHFENIFSLDSEISADIMREAVSVANALHETLKCDGINLIQSNGAAAGQEIYHFHLHIKPRWYDDDVVISWNRTHANHEINTDLASKLKERLAHRK